MTRIQPCDKAMMLGRAMLSAQCLGFFCSHCVEASSYQHLTRGSIYLNILTASDTVALTSLLSSLEQAANLD